MKNRFISLAVSVALVSIFLHIEWRGRSDAAPALKKIQTRSGVEMVLIPAGEFLMGSMRGSPDEQPVHRVKVSAFYMDTHLVTQEQYESVMGQNPSRWKGLKNPVEQVRWSDAVRYLNALSAAEGLEPCYNLKTWECDFEANGYRLPTEAEWEYACRAGTKGVYFFGDNAARLPAFAWFKANSGNRPRPVGSKPPNPWGLYDMLGNVWEWCHDRYDPAYYKKSPPVDPRGPATGATRVLRGGSWDSSATQCTVSYRHKDNPGYTDVCFGYDVYGFRAVRRAGK
ncbi:MAG: formylglycine-generating enzyme family protein [Armatimonadota bacterium]|nr:formylglycine-generating enzyme family protein [Armatimonadota bacterium]